MPVEDREEKERIIDLINTRFIVAPYDAIAAIKASDIWNENDNGWRDIYTDGSDILKNRFKIDTQILAIAIIKNVDTFFTNDGRLQNIGKKYLQTLSIPDIPQQGLLFE